MKSTPEPEPTIGRSAAGVGDPWRWAFGPAPAAAVLAIFWVVMVASLREKSPTYDEVAHAAAGYAYWHFGDYRLQPENGQLPQRAAGFPWRSPPRRFLPPIRRRGGTRMTGSSATSGSSGRAGTPGASRRAGAWPAGSLPWRLERSCSRGRGDYSGAGAPWSPFFSSP